MILRYMIVILACNKLSVEANCEHGECDKITFPSYPAKIEDFPYMVYIYQVVVEQGYRQSCSGALLTDITVITSGYCLMAVTDPDVGEWKQTEVWAGNSTIFKGSMRLIKTYKIHRCVKKGGRYKGDDIGLAWLNKKFYLGKTINVVSLPPVWMTCWRANMTGWGETDMDYGPKQFASNKELHTAHIRVYSQKKCCIIATKYLNQSSPKYLCLGNRKEKKEHRKLPWMDGDWGAPIVIRDVLGYWLIGIASRFVGEEAPSLSWGRNITYYYKWIMDNMNTTVDVDVANMPTTPKPNNNKKKAG